MICCDDGHAEPVGCYWWNSARKRFIDSSQRWRPMSYRKIEGFGENLVVEGINLAVSRLDTWRECVQLRWIDAPPRKSFWSCRRHDVSWSVQAWQVEASTCAHTSIISSTLHTTRSLGTSMIFASNRPKAYWNQHLLLANSRFANVGMWPEIPKVLKTLSTRRLQAHY